MWPTNLYKQICNYINNELGINLFKTQPEVRHVEQKNQIEKRYANEMKKQSKKLRTKCNKLILYPYPQYKYKLNLIDTGMSVCSLARRQKKNPTNANSSHIILSQHITEVASNSEDSNIYITLAHERYT